MLILEAIPKSAESESLWVGAGLHIFTKCLGSSYAHFSFKTLAPLLKRLIQEPEQKDDIIRLVTLPVLYGMELKNWSPNK